MTDLKRLPLLILLVTSLFTFACVYVVLPEGLEAPGSGDGAMTGVWGAFVTDVGQSEAGDLHIDITLRNDSGDWSTMQAMDGPAVLTTADGKTVNCDTVFMGTGGHRFAPGFQLRGYTTGENDDPQVQTLYVECKGVTVSAGSKLAINYESFNGILDDYDPEMNRVEGTLELNLDEIVADLTYPMAEPIDGLIRSAGDGIVGLSENVVTLLEVRRTEGGFEFDWQNFNPTKFPLKTHIGTPPVIGADGIIYGVYETLDIVEIPLTPPNENATWTTEVIVPEDVRGFYILLSVESNKPRTYINYAVDISDK
jgi:hypothetical protein